MNRVLRVQPSEDSKAPANALDIVTTTRVYTVCAESEDEEISWRMAISKVIGETPAESKIADLKVCDLSYFGFFLNL